MTDRKYLQHFLLALLAVDQIAQLAQRPKFDLQQAYDCGHFFKENSPREFSQAIEPPQAQRLNQCGRDQQLHQEFVKKLLDTASSSDIAEQIASYIDFIAANNKGTSNGPNEYVTTYLSGAWMPLIRICVIAVLVLDIWRQKPLLNKNTTLMIKPCSTQLQYTPIQMKHSSAHQSLQESEVSFSIKKKKPLLGEIAERNKKAFAMAISDTEGKSSFQASSKKDLKSFPDSAVGSGRNLMRSNATNHIKIEQLDSNGNGSSKSKATSHASSSKDSSESRDQLDQLADTDAHQSKYHHQNQFKFHTPGYQQHQGGNYPMQIGGGTYLTPQRNMLMSLKRGNSDKQLYNKMSQLVPTPQPANLGQIVRNQSLPRSGLSAQLSIQKQRLRRMSNQNEMVGMTPNLLSLPKQYAETRHPSTIQPQNKMPDVTLLGPGRPGLPNLMVTVEQLEKITSSNNSGCDKNGDPQSHFPSFFPQNNHLGIYKWEENPHFRVTGLKEEGGSINFNTQNGNFLGVARHPFNKSLQPSVQLMSQNSQEVGELQNAGSYKMDSSYLMQNQFKPQSNTDLPRATHNNHGSFNVGDDRSMSSGNAKANTDGGKGNNYINVSLRKGSHNQKQIEFSRSIYADQANFDNDASKTFNGFGAQPQNKLEGQPQNTVNLQPISASFSVPFNYQRQYSTNQGKMSGSYQSKLMSGSPSGIVRPPQGSQSIYQQLLSQNQGLSNQVKSLSKQLTNTKIFLNMVIHDMRNPTNSIEFALKEVIGMLLASAEKHQQEIARLRQINAAAFNLTSGTLLALPPAKTEIVDTTQQREDIEETKQQPNMFQNFNLPQIGSTRKSLMERQQNQLLNGQNFEAYSQSQTNNQLNITNQAQQLHAVQESNEESSHGHLNKNNLSLKEGLSPKSKHALTKRTIANNNSQLMDPIDSKPLLTVNKPLLIDQYGISFNGRGMRVSGGSNTAHQAVGTKKSINKESVALQSECMMISQDKVIPGVSSLYQKNESKNQAVAIAYMGTESKDLGLENDEFDSREAIKIPDLEARTNCLDTISEHVETLERPSPLAQRERPKFRRFIQLTDIIETPASILTRYKKEPIVGDNQTNTLHQEIVASRGERNQNTLDHLRVGGNNYLNNLFQSNNGEKQFHSRYGKTAESNNPSVKLLIPHNNYSNSPLRQNGPSKYDPQAALDAFVAHHERVPHHSRSLSPSKREEASHLNEEDLPENDEQEEGRTGWTGIFVKSNTPSKSIAGQAENVENNTNNRDDAFGLDISRGASHIQSQNINNFALQNHSVFERILDRRLTIPKGHSPFQSNAENEERKNPLNRNQSDSNNSICLSIQNAQEKLQSRSVSRGANHPLQDNVFLNMAFSHNLASPDQYIRQRKGSRGFNMHRERTSGNPLNFDLKSQSSGHFRNRSQSQRKEALQMASLPRLSHSPKGQLNVMQLVLNSALLLSKDDKKQCEQWLKNSLFSSQMLLNLINDLLDLAKIENMKFNFNTTQFNLHEIIQKAIDTLDFSAQQKNITMEYQFDQENAGYLMDILGDDNRYLQILLNFLSNALKFTNQNGNVIVKTKLLDTQHILGNTGPINFKQSKGKEEKEEALKKQNSVVNRQTSESLEPCITDYKSKPLSGAGCSGDASLQPRKKRRTNGHVQETAEGKKSRAEELASASLNKRVVQKYIKFEIRIIDSGVGISQENISKLFMNFSKLEEHASGNKTGTGLGLSICKSLIELMGGSVTVESELGVGTTFIMQLQTKCNMLGSKKVSKWLKKFKKTTKKDPEDGCDDNTKLETEGIGLKTVFTQFDKLDVSQRRDKSTKVLCGNDRLYDEDDMYFSTLAKSASKQRLQFIGNIGNLQNKNTLEIAQLRRGTVHCRGNIMQRVLNSASQVPNLRKAPKTPKRQVKSSSSDASISSDSSGENDNSKRTANEEARHDDVECDDDEQSMESHSFSSQEPIFRALVANDDSFQLRIISSLMEQLDFQVTQAENGLVAIQQNQQALQQGNPFDVIILDLDMPIINGFEACQRIRNGDEKENLMQLIQIDQKKKVPSSQHSQNLQENTCDKEKDLTLIVALSGLITEQIISRGIACGFDEFIETPLTIDKIQNKIIKAIELRDQERLKLLDTRNIGAQHGSQQYPFMHPEQMLLSQSPMSLQGGDGMLGVEPHSYNYANSQLVQEMQGSFEHTFNRQNHGYFTTQIKNTQHHTTDRQCQSTDQKHEKQQPMLMNGSFTLAQESNGETLLGSSNSRMHLELQNQPSYSSVIQASTLMHKQVYKQQLLRQQAADQYYGEVPTINNRATSNFQ